MRWERPSMPMSSRGWATEIMVALQQSGATVPLTTLDGFTMQDMLTDMVETIMDQTVIHDYRTQI